MKFFLRLPLIAAAALLMAISAKAAITTVNGFAITSGSYSGTGDWSAAVKTEFGNTATVASFESLKLAFSADPSALATLLAGGPASVTYGGSQNFEPTRPYFITYHGSTVPGGWLVHDKIGDVSTGNQISLGSYNSSKRIIAYIGTAVPEPSSLVIVGVFCLGAVSSRRRTHG